MLPIAWHYFDLSSPGRPMEPWILRRQWRLYGVLMLIIGVPLLLLIGAIVMPVHMQLEAEAEAKNRLLSQLLAAAVDEELNGLKNHVSSVANRPHLSDAMIDADTGVLIGHLAGLVNDSPRITRAFIADPHGIELYDYPHDPTVIGEDFSYRDWFRGVSTAGTTYVSEMYRRAALNQVPVVSVAAPIRHVDGHVVGYLVGQYPLQDLRRRISSMYPMDSASFALMDQNGASISMIGVDGESREGGRRSAGRSPNGAMTPGALAAAGPEGDHLISVAPIPASGWTAVSYMSTDVIGGPIRSLLQTIFLLFGICAVAMLLLSGVLVKSLRRHSDAVGAANRALRHAVQAAEDANQAKTDFMAVVSHELRTPLNGVIGMTELLQDTSLDDRQRRFLSACQESARTLLELVNDVLDLSKIEADRLELASEEFALHQCIDDSVSLMAHRAHAKEIEITYYVDPRVRQRVCGDDARLRQVLVNLLSNAIKFTSEGQVVLRAVLDQQDRDSLVVRFSVTDTGIGIPQHALGGLFQSFVQVDRSTTRKYGGTGLGLVICRRLVTAMGGEIGVESRHGLGSTFWFTVRLARVPSESQDLLMAPPDLASIRVLVISECETGRSILAQTFAAWDMQADVAAPTERLARMLCDMQPQSPPFDLVIIDLAISEGPCADLARTLLKHDRPLAVPLFALVPTGKVCPENFLGSRLISRRLRKPPSASELLNALIDRFCACCPPAADPDATPPPACAVPTSTPLRGRILLAEDNATSRLYVCEILHRRGLSCEVVTSGREAIEAVSRTPYDLILMDCHMPELDGFDATATIRRLEAEGTLQGRVPILALTANAIEGDRQRCLQAGMDDYLSKPVRADALLARIEHWLTQRPSVLPQPSARPPIPVLSAADCGCEAATDQAQKCCSVRPVEEVIDVESALERCLGDMEFLVETLASFEQETSTYIDRLETGAAQGDARSVAESAHAIKGAASMVSAESLRQVAGELETLGRAADVAAAAKRTPALREEFERCVEFIRAHRESFLNGAQGPAE